MTDQPLIGAKITEGPQQWEVVQRDPDGQGTVNIAGTWWAETPGVVEVRIASEYDNSAASGCDWQPAEMLDDRRWRATLRPPTGGLYSIETRLNLLTGGYWRYAGDKIHNVSVGDIWVIAGQSNAAGYGHGPVVDPPALGVSVFGMDDVWRLATHPIFDSTNTKHPANRDAGWVDVSPWLAFGKEVLRQAGVPIGLIPTALGGSALSTWDPGNGPKAILYHNMLDMIEAAGGRIAGMLWYQGCSDTQPEPAATYPERFTRFIEVFREKYGANLPIITAQLNRHYDCLPEEQQGWSLVREAQRQAAQTIPNIAVIPTLDLSLADGIHTSAVGNVTLGERFARTALGMVYGKESDWKAADVKEARFIDAKRTAIRICFDNVSGYMNFLDAAPTDFVVEDSKGAVEIVAARVEDDRHVVLELSRPAEGKTVCHNMPGGNPLSTLRDHRQWPVLAFHGVEVT